MVSLGTAFRRLCNQQLECPECGAEVDLQEQEDGNYLMCTEECGAEGVRVG